MAGPRLFEVLKHGYSLKVFGHDLSAGLVVGVVAIPLALAFAIASGLPPEKGLLTAVIAGFCISALGGSNVQIGGPTGAFIVIVFGIQQKFGPDGLILATAMAGVFLLILGLAKLGTVIQYIPYPVIVGFTSGIAVTILSSQINDFLGLGLSGIPPDFIDKWEVFLSHLGQTNLWSLGLAVGTIVVVVGLGKISHRIPAALLVLVASTLAVTLFHLPVETIGSRFGVVSGSLPLPTLPAGLSHWQALLLPALSIAMLAGIESLLSAAVADGLTGKKHNPHQELIGQGVANLASAFFGGMPATGAIARTATNVKSGGQTPVAGLVHSVFILLVMLFLAPLASMIPLSALAGILVTVSYNMSEHRTFRMLLKGPRGDMAVLLATFFLTVLVDLTVAIPVGVLFALLFFMRNMSRSGAVTVHRDELRDSPDIDPFGLTTIVLPPGVEVFEVEGPFFFGAAERFKEAMLVVESPPRVRILRLRHVSSIDASGIVVLSDLWKLSRTSGTHLLLAAVRPEVRSALDKIGFTERLGEENIVPDVVAAVERAQKLLGHTELTLADRLRRGGTLRLAGGDALTVIRAAEAGLPLAPATAKHLVRSMVERETLASTALGHGLAFPHPRQPVLGDHDAEFVTLAYLERPVSWGEQPVTAVFFIGARSVASHLATLAELARSARHRVFEALIESRASADQLAAWWEESRLQTKTASDTFPATP